MSVCTFDLSIETADDMLVSADYLEDRGDLACYDWRAAFWMRIQAEQITQQELHATASRHYSDYWTNESDFDFFAAGGEPTELRKLLAKAGWRRGKYQSWYKSGVKLILPDDFDAWREATAACVEARPQRRNDAIGIFRDCGIN